MSEPAEVKFLPERYSFRYEDGVEFRMERFEDKREGLRVELTTQHANGNGVRLIDFGHLNLGAPTSRKSLAKLYEEKFPRIKAAEWGDRLLAITYLAVEKYRNGGEPFVDLKSVEVDYSKPVLLLPPLIPSIGSVLDYGNGEVGKSMFVMAQAITVATGQPILGLQPTLIGVVLYLDWEDNGQAQKERAEALCRGMDVEFPGQSIIFRRMDRSLVDSEELIRNAVAEYHIVLVIVDSLGMAVGTDPSDPVAVIQSMNVLARLGIPSIVIHHLSAEQAYGNARKEKPYGTIYARNTARLTWLLERDVETGGPLYLTNTKSNRTKRHPRIAFDLEIESDANEHLISARYTAESVAGYRDVMGKMTDLDKIKTALASMKAPVSTIAKNTGMSEGAVRKVISRHADEFGSEQRGRENWWFLVSDRNEPW